MIPEVSSAECCVNLSLLVLGAFCANEFLKVILEVLSQQANIWMYFGLPVRVYIINVWHVDLLASQPSYDLGAMILLSRRNMGRS